MTFAVQTKWLLLLAIIGVLLVAACSSGDEESEDVVFNVPISGASPEPMQSNLEVKQGDFVTFNVTSDSQASFHLHGYDHELELAPNVTGTFTFTADATGSFPITIHLGGAGGEDHHSMSGDAMDGDAKMAGMDHHELTIGTPLDMSVGVEAELDGETAANLKITTSGFTFMPESVNGAHVDGEGHAHVYVDGVKINRIYGPYYHLPGLSPGERSIRITLNANSHEQYAIGDHPVEATTTLMVPGDAMAGGEHQMTASTPDNPIEFELGRFVVLPR